MNLWIKDPKTGKESVTLTVFIYGFTIATIKLLLAGLDVMGKFEFSQFTGVDYAAVIGALGAVYTMRKNNSIKPEDPNKKDIT